MNVIGHRGAANIAPENTIIGIKTAMKAGVDAVEFDIRVSKDMKLYLCHDASLNRTYGIDRKVSDLTSTELDNIKDKDGNQIPTLELALEACGKTTAIIEAKSGNWSDPLSKILHSHPNKKIHSVISFNHQELNKFQKLQPDIPLYVLEHRNAFDAINAARLYGFQGIDVNFWTLNPLAYALAWRHNLDIIVFTVNKVWIAKFLRLLYPGIAITTNDPLVMQQFRTNKRKKK